MAELACSSSNRAKLFSIFFLQLFARAKFLSHIRKRLISSRFGFIIDLTELNSNQLIFFHADNIKSCIASKQSKQKQQNSFTIHLKIKSNILLLPVPFFCRLSIYMSL